MAQSEGDYPVRPARFRSSEDFERCIPVHAVWEITLACDLKCQHCGSRAGRARPNELNSQECLDVIDALARLGTREVNLIGGEAYLRPDWATLVGHIRSRGMNCLIQTGGRNFKDSFIQAAVGAGLNGLGVSLDGMRELHDEVRGVPGSFDRAIATLQRARAAGLSISVNTQIGSRTAPDLPALLDVIAGVGATHWQLQLTVAMGNAADNEELLLQPHALLEMMPLLARLYEEGKKRGVLLLMGNNIGYFGPYEHLWRGFGDERVHWTGCSGGHTVIAIESDGLVKGCPSLESGEFGAGNIRNMSLEDIWERSERIRFSRLRSSEELWGFCGSCYYRETCLGGCTWTSHSLLGRAGNNPYCHYRALDLQKRGLRERIVKIEDAPARSFAIGKFALVCETIDGKELVAEPTPVRGEQARLVQPAFLRQDAPTVPRTPANLGLCRSCLEYVQKHEEICPHCGANIAGAQALWAAARSRGLAAMSKLQAALEALSGAPLPGRDTDHSKSLNQEIHK